MKTTMFRVDMLRAFLDGRKTQTRRIIKLRDFGISDTKGYDFHFRDKRMLWNDVSKDRLIEMKCPYQVGDIVGIRENFEIVNCRYSDQGDLYGMDIEYCFDNSIHYCISLGFEETEKFEKWKKKIGKKSKLFMFDSLIRYKMQIENIRVERINDISDQDCIDEGTKLYFYKALKRANPDYDFEFIRGSFIELWDSINKKCGYGWDKNNWVFAYDIKQVNNDK